MLCWQWGDEMGGARWQYTALARARDMGLGKGRGGGLNVSDTNRRERVDWLGQGEGDLSITTSTRLLSADAAGAFVVGLEDEFLEARAHSHTCSLTD